VKAQITRGERIRALITQPRLSALRLVDEVALLAALDAGVFDPLPVEVIKLVRAHLTAHLDTHQSEIVTVVTQTGKIDDTALAALVAAVRDLAQVLAADVKREAPVS